MHRHRQTHTGTYRHTQTHTGTYRHTQTPTRTHVHTNTCRNAAHTDTDHRHPLQTMHTPVADTTACFVRASMYPPGDPVGLHVVLIHPCRALDGRRQLGRPCSVRASPCTARTPWRVAAQVLGTLGPGRGHGPRLLALQGPTDGGGHWACAGRRCGFCGTKNRDGREGQCWWCCNTRVVMAG